MIYKFINLNPFFNVKAFKKTFLHLFGHLLLLVRGRGIYALFKCLMF